MSGIGIGLKIKQAREAQRIELEALAEEIGASSTYLEMLEMDLFNPDVGTMMDIAKHLKVKVVDLIPEDI